MASTLISITQISTADSDFENQLARLLRREMLVNDEVTSTVSNILQAVRSRGDQAVLEFTTKFDGFDAKSMGDLQVTPEQMASSLEKLPAAQKQALVHATERIRRYHEKQKQSSWQYQESDGSI